MEDPWGIDPTASSLGRKLVKRKNTAPVNSAAKMWKPAAPGSDGSLDAVATTAAAAREKAHQEMDDGQKKGHWVWWAFPTLRERGGDSNSACQRPNADLKDVEAAVAYAQHAALRTQLLETLSVADAAFRKAGSQGPWRVLDKGFGRASDGQWVRGPVDAFKAFCSCTLFAAIAHRLGDAQLKAAALQTLTHFTGDIVYTAGKKGTAGYAEDGSDPRVVLKGYDAVTLALVGGDWSEICA